MNIGLLTTEILERFLSKVKMPTTAKPGGCWIWTASKNNKGYGYFYLRGKNHSAHKASYILFVSEIPDNLCVLHKCDTPLCVRPAHLYLGTQLDNMRDALQKDRVVRGETNGQSKLTERQIREIRELRKQGWTFEQIGKRYGIVQATAYNIANKISWKHIE